MRYSILSAILFTSLTAFSQECSKELLKQKPGTWKAGSKGSVANVSTADLIKEKL